MKNTIHRFLSPLLFTFFSLAVICIPHSVFAGVGISPSAIQNAFLLPGSQQTITVYASRSTTEEEWKLTPVLSENIQPFITLDAQEYTFDTQQQELPIVIHIEVPKDTKYDSYNGTLQFQVEQKNDTSDESDTKSNTINTHFGLSIPVELTVRDVEKKEMILSDLQLFSGSATQPLVIQYRLQNTGNVPVPFPQLTVKAKTMKKVDAHIVYGDEFEIYSGVESDATINPFHSVVYTQEIEHSLDADTLYTVYARLTADSTVSPIEEQFSVQFVSEDMSLPKPGIENDEGISTNQTAQELLSIQQSDDSDTNDTEKTGFFTYIIPALLFIFIAAIAYYLFLYSGKVKKTVSRPKKK